MTIEETIRRLDSLMHNTWSDHDKRQWLSAVEGQIRDQIIATHQGAPAENGGQLLAQPPYDAMYLHYLMAQIHYHNGEFQRYNNAIAMFQSCFDSFANHYNRTHQPRGAALRYF